MKKKASDKIVPTPDGLLAIILNEVAVVEYAYTLDRLDAWFTLTLSNSVVFSRNVVRDGYRRSLVTGITSSANGNAVENLAYAYDALSRPTSRNADAFGYNDRSEVVSAQVGTSHFARTYDNNGNVTRYLDANGNIVAQYTYDAFGKIIAQAGTLADFFRHRFSTKYFDSETGLYYYGYRFYSPQLMRWLNRDPIEEEGGLNLYGFCGNNAIYSIDPCGLTVIVHMNPTPSRQENIKDRLGRNLKVRGATKILGDIQFVCNKCVLRAKGVVQLWIELINENDDKWNIRYKRYAQSDKSEEMNTLAHEMDHFNTWKAFLEFVKTANSIDGKQVDGCVNKASRLNALYRQYKAITKSHSLKFDQPGWNTGGQYSKHPLDTSTFKWE